MNPESKTSSTGFDPSDPSLHLEYLYGPQWQEVLRIIERAAQLNAVERDKLSAEANNRLQSGLSALSGSDGLAGLISGFSKPSADAKAAQIAADTAKEFGRSRNIQIAGLIAGQAVSPTAATGIDDLSGLLQSIGALTTVSRAVTAAVLGDLIGCGSFTQEIYDELMRPWSDHI